MEFDARDPAHEIEGVPFHTLARIRSEQPICPSPKGGWYLSTRRHIDTALKEVEIFVADLAPMAGLPGTEVVPPEELFLSEIPEPRHGRIRRLYNSNFAPHRLRNTEEFGCSIRCWRQVREICTRATPCRSPVPRWPT